MCSANDNMTAIVDISPSSIVRMRIYAGSPSVELRYGGPHEKAYEALGDWGLRQVALEWYRPTPGSRVRVRTDRSRASSVILMWTREGRPTLRMYAKQYQWEEARAEAQRRMK